MVFLHGTNEATFVETKACLNTANVLKTKKPEVLMEVEIETFKTESHI